MVSARGSWSTDDDFTTGPIGTQAKIDPLELTTPSRVVLIDFSLAREFPQTKVFAGPLPRGERHSQAFSRERSPRGSPVWLAPEVLDEGRLSVLADIWSLGIVLLQFFSNPRRYPFLPVHLPERYRAERESQFVNNVVVSSSEEMSEDQLPQSSSSRRSSPAVGEVMISSRHSDYLPPGYQGLFLNNGRDIIGYDEWAEVFPPQNVWDAMVDALLGEDGGEGRFVVLLKKMLRVDPEERIGLAEALVELRQL